MDVTSDKNLMNTLVLGATGSIGYAVTVNLLARQLPVTILVRSRAKAVALFPNAPTLTIVEGDAQDMSLLSKLAADKNFIFHGINYPYNKWFGNMDTVTQKVIDAASINHATIVFPVTFIITAMRASQFGKIALQTRLPGKGSCV